MAVIAKQELSGGTDGIGVKVAATASAGTTIHTANNVTGAGLYDEIYLYATNTNTSAETLVIQFGGTTAVDNEIRHVVQPDETILVVPGLILQNALVVKAYSTTANKVTIHGFVNRITAS
jgi:hypothetical protein|tara:strand:+ start:806 stop:1165 length:360 start_codon:yes stop_codon:yes gene_type:complete